MRNIDKAIEKLNFPNTARITTIATSNLAEDAHRQLLHTVIIM